MSQTGIDYTRLDVPPVEPHNVSRLVFRNHKGERVECRGHLSEGCGRFLMHIEEDTRVQRIINLRASSVEISRIGRHRNIPVGRLISIETEAVDYV